MNQGKSFNRILSRKSFKNSRPKSSFKSSSSFISLKNNISTICIKSHHQILTRPDNTSKKLKGMGNKFEREELYQLNQELKSKVNKLKEELYEAKGIITKKDREIKRKEKIIRDIYNEIQNPTSSYQKSFDKAKESTLLSLCKEQYNELKKDYDKKLEEIEVLNMNIKITQIKELKIQISTLKSEMIKLRNLYKNASKENILLKNKINELIEFRNKYSQQHSIIDRCMKKVNDYNNNLMELELANEELQNELNKKVKKNLYFKSQNNKLKISNEKYLQERKTRDYFNIFNLDSTNKISKLKKELDEYKKLYNLKEQQIKKYEKNYGTKNQNKIEEVKEFNYNKIINIEREPVDESDKIKLLKSLLEEKQKEIEIFSNFLISKNLNPELILQGISINTYSNPNTNNINNMSNSQTIKINSSIKDLNISAKKSENNNINSNNKKEIEEKNKNSINLNSVNTNTNNNKNSSNNQNDENNSQLYNAAVINSNDNENDNNSEEQMKYSELTSNDKEFNK